MNENDTDQAKSHIDKVEKYFDENADFWSELYDTPTSDNDLILANRTAVAVELTTKDLPDNSLVFDVGCGAGVASLKVALLGHRVHGLDIADDLLEFARDRFRDAGISDDRWKFTHGDLISTDLGKCEFDAIMALGFIQYQPDELEALSFFHRILKPGGRLVITGPTKYRLSRLLDYEHHVKSLRRLLSGKSAQKRSAEHERVLEISPHHYSMRRFRKLLHSSGFEVTESLGHGFGDYDRYLSKINKVLPIGRWANDLIFAADRKD